MWGELGLPKECGDGEVLLGEELEAVDVQVCRDGSASVVLHRQAPVAVDGNGCAHCNGCVRRDMV